MILGEAVNIRQGYSVNHVCFCRSGGGRYRVVVVVWQQSLMNSNLTESGDEPSRQREAENLAGQAFAIRQTKRYPVVYILAAFYANEAGDWPV
jgi:hypothetical protein